MLVKITLLFISVCSIKAVSSERDGRWIFDTIEKYKPEITRIKLSIETLVNKTTENEDMISFSKLRLSLIRKESETLVESLKNIVRNTSTEATDENIDVSNCTEEETKSQNALETYVFNDVETIETKYSTEYAKIMSALVALKSTLSPLTHNIDALLRNCALHNFLPWHNQQLISCITRGIDDAKGKISEIESNVESIRDSTEKLFDDLDKDVAEFMQNIVQDIVGIVENLKKCIVMWVPEKVPEKAPTF